MAPKLRGRVGVDRAAGRPFWVPIALAGFACGQAADDPVEQLTPAGGDEVAPPVTIVPPRAPSPSGVSEVAHAGSEASADEGAHRVLAATELPGFGDYIAPFPFPENGPPDVQERWLLDQSENILLANCGQCHGPRSAFEVQGDFGDVDDIDAVVRQGQLIRCDALHSPLILRMLDGSMPPAPLASVSAADIAVVRDVTDFGCASP